MREVCFCEETHFSHIYGSPCRGRGHPHISTNRLSNYVIMELRRYKSSDLEQIATLFHDTVHTVNANDYTDKQLDVWATGIIDHGEWDRSFREHLTYVATVDDKIIGFGDIDSTGYLDKLYVHKDFQSIGVATAICDRLETESDFPLITVHASITAKPFFEKRGYLATKEQEVERQDILLKNYVMQKRMTPAGP